MGKDQSTQSQTKTNLIYGSSYKILSCSTDLTTEYLDFGRGGHLTSSRTKRMRTSFKHHQLRTMKSYFAVNHNPDAKDLKQLSQKTGLPKRVLQVNLFIAFLLLLLCCRLSHLLHFYVQIVLFSVIGFEVLLLWCQFKLMTFAYLFPLKFCFVQHICRKYKILFKYLHLQAMQEKLVSV